MAADKGPSLIEVPDTAVREAIGALHEAADALTHLQSPTVPGLSTPALLARIEAAHRALSRELDPRSFK